MEVGNVSAKFMSRENLFTRMVWNYAGQDAWQKLFKIKLLFALWGTQAFCQFTVAERSENDENHYN